MRENEAVNTGNNQPTFTAFMNIEAQPGSDSISTYTFDNLRNEIYLKAGKRIQNVVLGDICGTKGGVRTPDGMLFYQHARFVNVPEVEVDPHEVGSQEMPEQI